jgi:hypothetical protein
MPPQTAGRALDVAWQWLLTRALPEKPHNDLKFSGALSDADHKLTEIKTKLT